MTQKPSIGSSSVPAPWTCWARHIKSLDGFVFFRLSYFDYGDLQLFAIFIFEVDFSETYLMTSAENSVSEPSNLKIFWGRIPPHTPYKAHAFITRDNAPPITKNLAIVLYKIINLLNNWAWLSLSVKQHQNPCSGPPPVYQVFEYGHDFPLKKPLSISQSGWREAHIFQ